MEMTGEQRIAAPRAKVWAALNDPEVLRRCIPGCQSLEKEADDRLKATVEIKIGPIGARFVGAVTLTDINAPNGYTITGEGQGGTVGFAKGGAKVKLADDGAEATILSYTVDAQVGGRLAQLGGPIIDATAKRLAGKFFDTFGEVVAGGGVTAGDGKVESAPSVGRSVNVPASPVASAPVSTPVAASGPPMAWVLATVLAALIGYMIGRSQGMPGSDWEGLAIGLLLLVVAVAGFEYGRRR
jgi:carbon monoxide dehydrogenase subunit G